MRVRSSELRRRVAQRVTVERTRLARLILPPARASPVDPPELEPRHVEACRVVASREQMISEWLPKHAVVAEVGTYRGDNARTILDGAAPRELHLIDRDFTVFQRHRFVRELGEGILLLNENDSSVALGDYPDEYFDWIYIDGDNTYDGLKRDVDEAKRAVKRDGLLVFRNYMFFSHNDLHPVAFVHVVNELCVHEDWSLRYLALQHRMYLDVAVGRMLGRTPGATYDEPGSSSSAW